MSLITITKETTTKKVDKRSKLLDKLIDDLNELTSNAELSSRSYDLSKYFSPVVKPSYVTKSLFDEDTEQTDEWKPVCDEETFRKELEAYPHYRQKIIRVVKSNILQAASEDRWAAHLLELAIDNLESFL